MSSRSVFVVAMLLLCGFGGWKYQQSTAAEEAAAAAPPSSQGQIVVYGRESCGYTRRTLAALRDARVPMTYRDIDDPAIQAEFQARFADTDLAGDQGYPLPIVEVNGHASARPDPSGLLSDFRISQRIAAQSAHAN